MSEGVPDGWEERTFRTLSSTVTKGTTPTTYGYQYTDSGVNFLRVENISDTGRILLRDLKFIDTETNAALKRSQLREGDLLVSIAGAIGRSALVSKGHLPANTNQAVGIVRLDSVSADKQYIRYSIDSPSVQKQVNDIQAGLAQSNLNLEQLGNIKVLLPPKPEQQKIASILTSVDEVIEKTEAQISKLQDLKQGMMQELLTKGIGHTEFKDSPVGRIPKGWKVKLLGNTAEFINGRAYKLSEREKEGVPVIRLQNLTQQGGEFYYSTLKLPEKQYCQKGDLLYMWSASFGPCIWWGNKAIFHYHIWKVMPKPSEMDKTYLFFFLQQKIEEWKQNTSGMAMLHLTKKGMEETDVPVPPLSEQKKIASALSSIELNIQWIISKLIQYRSVKKALIQDLLTGKVRVKTDGQA